MVLQNPPVVFTHPVYLLSKTSSPVLGRTQPHIQQINESSFPNGNTAFYLVPTLRMSGGIHLRPLCCLRGVHWHIFTFTVSTHRRNSSLSKAAVGSSKRSMEYRFTQRLMSLLQQHCDRYVCLLYFPLMQQGPGAEVHSCDVRSSADFEGNRFKKTAGNFISFRKKIRRLFIYCIAVSYAQNFNRFSRTFIAHLMNFGNYLQKN